jgi:hypothetical protein
MVKRAAWLSITPEPERELPEAVATLTAGRRASPGAAQAEAVKIERLLLHGGQRRWLRYLHGVVELIDARAECTDPDVRRARDRARAVIANHHNLMLALQARPSGLTAIDRARLAAPDLKESPR